MEVFLPAFAHNKEREKRLKMNEMIVDGGEARGRGGGREDGGSGDGGREDGGSGGSDGRDGDTVVVTGGNMEANGGIIDLDDDVLEIQADTKELLEANGQHTTKKLSDVTCPICFDEISKATATSCGHLFCLECLQKSLSTSSARGQVRGRRGTGLCPLCRKMVVFRDTVVVRARAMKRVVPPVDR